MIQITDRALDELEHLREASSPQSGQGITLIVADSGELGFALGYPSENDQVFERSGEPVMIIPEVLSEPLDGIVLDYVDTGEAQGFTLERPA